MCAKLKWFNGWRVPFRATISGGYDHMKCEYGLCTDRAAPSLYHIDQGEGCIEVRESAEALLVAYYWLLGTGKSKKVATDNTEDSHWKRLDRESRRYLEGLIDWEEHGVEASDCSLLHHFNTWIYGRTATWKCNDRDQVRTAVRGIGGLMCT